MLQVQNLNGIRNQQTLFASLSFTLNPGELLLVEGPNGSGKSTLLRMLAGLLTANNGEIFWQGQSIAKTPESLQMNLNYLSHMNGIKLGLTVCENLSLAEVLSSQIFTDSNREKFLSALNLNQQQHLQARYLSQGQRRRLALAKIFLSKKLLWILDEPTTALDAMSQEFFLEQLTLHLKKGGMAIVSSHQPLNALPTKIQMVRLPC